LSQPLIRLERVTVSFEESRGLTKKLKVEALREASLDVWEGKGLVVVGESGAGKTTLGRVIVGVQRPSSGRVLFKGKDLWRERGAFKEFRRLVQLVPQDPYGSLSPNKTILDQLSPPLKKWKGLKGREIREEASRLLSLVRLTPPESFLSKYPHQLSGGQRQRVNIARALSVDPKVLVADEPVTMIDASMRIGILTTLAEISRKLGIAVIMITHDLAIARYFADLMGSVEGVVMYRGKIIEVSPVEELVSTPLHPYTSTLIKAVPDIAALGSEQEVGLEEIDVPQGPQIDRICPYVSVCKFAMSVCKRGDPELKQVSSAHRVACYLYGGKAEAD